MAQFFARHEIACKCGCARAEMDAGFMRKLNALRGALGFPFVLNSAFRCPSHNARVSATGEDGPHTTGRAVDVRASGERALLIVERARDFGFTGIGISQRGDHTSRFIHLDDLPDAPGQPRPWLWGY